MVPVSRACSEARKKNLLSSGWITVEIHLFSCAYAEIGIRLAQSMCRLYSLSCLMQFFGKVRGERIIKEANMALIIEYCGMWNYLPEASGLKSALLSEFPGLEIKLVEGSHGIFEVMFNGEVVFSKDTAGRFPEELEIVETLKKLHAS